MAVDQTSRRCWPLVPTRPEHSSPQGGRKMCICAWVVVCMCWRRWWCWQWRGKVATSHTDSRSVVDAIHASDQLAPHVFHGLLHRMVTIVQGRQTAAGLHRCCLDASTVWHMRTLATACEVGPSIRCLLDSAHQAWLGAKEGGREVGGGMDGTSSA